MTFPEEASIVAFGVICLLTLLALFDKNMRFSLKSMFIAVTLSAVLIGGFFQRLETKRYARYERVRGFGLIGKWSFDHEIVQMKPNRIDAVTLVIRLNGVPGGIGLQISNWDYRW